MGSIPTLNFPDIQISDIHLNVDSSDSGYDGLTGKLPYVLLTVKFAGISGNPISGSLFGLGFSVNPFSVNVKSFLTAFGPGLMNTVVGYASQIGTDFIENLDTNFVYMHEARNAVADLITQGQSFLDGHALDVGNAITPWLLGAAYAVYGVSYDPANSQPVPPDGPQGDLVIQYVGEIPPPAGGGVLTSAGSVEALDTSSSRPLSLNQTNPTAGIVGTPYSQVFSAFGGTAPYTFTITGSLPPATTASDAQISGTPTTAGVYSVAVTVRDAAGTQISQNFFVVINPAGLSITNNDPLPGGVITHFYAVQLAVQNDAGAKFTWSDAESSRGPYFAAARRN